MPPFIPPQSSSSPKKNFVYDPIEKIDVGSGLNKKTLTESEKTELGSAILIDVCKGSARLPVVDSMCYDSVNSGKRIFEAINKGDIYIDTITGKVCVDSVWEGGKKSKKSAKKRSKKSSKRRASKKSRKTRRK